MNLLKHFFDGLDSFQLVGLICGMPTLKKKKKYTEKDVYKKVFKV
jgi:hypothetical protein